LHLATKGPRRPGEERPWILAPMYLGGREHSSSLIDWLRGRKQNMPFNVVTRGPVLRNGQKKRPKLIRRKSRNKSKSRGAGT